MNIRHAVVCLALLSLTGTLHAQVCAGGVGGGMDATGNDCNESNSLLEVIPLAIELDTTGTPASTLISATLSAADWQVIAESDAPASAGRAEAAERWERGLAEYELGHQAQAVLDLRRAGDRSLSPSRPIPDTREKTMDAPRAHSPASPPGAVGDTSWRSSASAISCLYFTALIAGFGLAIGLTSVFMQPPARVKIALPERAGVSGYSERVHWDANKLGTDQLKMYYLACARDSGWRAADEEAACSEAADILLAHSFDGDFTRMVDWWRTATCLAPDGSVSTGCQ